MRCLIGSQCTDLSIGVMCSNVLLYILILYILAGKAAELKLHVPIDIYKLHVPRIDCYIIFDLDLKRKSTPNENETRSVFSN